MSSEMTPYNLVHSTLKLEAAEGSATAGTHQIPVTILYKSTFTAHTRPNKIPVTVIIKRKGGSTR